LLKKHELMNDVAAEFLKVFKVPRQDRFKVKIRWWNIGKCHEPWCMHIEQSMDLTGDQYRQFKPYRYVSQTESLERRRSGIDEI
jgi:hypothetical protein